MLAGLTVDGVTAYPQSEFAPLYSDDLAREVGLQDLVRVAQAISDRYRADGYFLSRAVVPPQPPAGGLARIRVYEGYVGEVAFEGERSAAVERLFSGLEQQRPLRLADLERRQALAEDLPGVKVRTRLEPVLEDPARHRLVVIVEQSAFSANLYSDNRGADASGPWQVYGWVGTNSVLVSGDQIGLGVLSTPADTDEFTYAEASYGLPTAGGGRLRLAVSASTSEAGQEAAFGSESRTVSVRYLHPLIRSRRQSVWLNLVFDAREVQQRWPGWAEMEDQLRVLRAGVFGDRSWSGGRTTFGVQLSHGVEALGASKNISTRHSRWDADSGFWKANVQASHYANIGRHMGIYLAADAQYAPDPLLASEEFSAGALPYGRAYNYSEIMGESGIAGLAELRLGWPVKARPLTFVQTYAFVDGAKVWNPTNIPGYRRASLASAGIGLRLSLTHDVVLRAELAKPLSRKPFDQPDRRWRPFVSLSAAF